MGMDSSLKCEWPTHLGIAPLSMSSVFCPVIRSEMIINVMFFLKVKWVKPG
jgi:hypothetical protein